MLRSDALLGMHRLCEAVEEDRRLVDTVKEMHDTIEAAYKIAFALQESGDFKDLGDLIYGSLAQGSVK